MALSHKLQGHESPLESSVMNRKLGQSFGTLAGGALSSGRPRMTNLTSRETCGGHVRWFQIHTARLTAQRKGVFFVSTYMQPGLLPPRDGDGGPWSYPMAPGEGRSV